MTGFVQQGPELSNQFTSDLWLQHLLKWRLSKEQYNSIQTELNELGELAAGPLSEWAWQAETNPPRHVPFNPWGQRSDQVQVHSSWQQLNDFSAQAGLVAIGYERPLKENSRLFQFAKLYLFHPSSAFYSCPLAMTDGAARILELHGTSAETKEAYKHLISRDPKNFWTSGQWMTEKTGGSDVSFTETEARRNGAQFQLYGTKWFTSAISAQMSLALGRVTGAAQGSKGLSLFYVRLHDAKGVLQNIRVHRLKDKMGTKALPTAEIELCGTPASLIGEEGLGVKTVATMLNITRAYNSVCSVAQAQRALYLVKNYSRLRKVFGKAMVEQPLHLETLANSTSEFVGHLLLTFEIARLLGREETKCATENEVHLLRLLTPITKLTTGKMSIATCSEMLECFGGVGYCEDSRIPVLFRDAQVFPIWEGATNVLSLDVIRVLQKPQAFHAYVQIVQEKLKASSSRWADDVRMIQLALDSLVHFVPTLAEKDSDEVQAVARDLAFGLGRVYMAALMIEFGSWGEKNNAKMPIGDVLNRFISKGLVGSLAADKKHRQGSVDLALWS